MGVCSHVHLGWRHRVVCVCVHVRRGLSDYKEEVNGKYTLSDKVRGRHSFAVPLPVPSFSSLPPQWQGPGKIKQVVCSWQESWPGLGWAGLQAAGGYQKLLAPALGQRHEWPRASLSCEFWELPWGPSNTSELPIWCSLGNYRDQALHPDPHPFLAAISLHSSTPDIKEMKEHHSSLGGGRRGRLDHTEHHRPVLGDTG